MSEGGDPRRFVTALSDMLRAQEGRKLSLDEIRAADRSFTVTLAAVTLCLADKLLHDDSDLEDALSQQAVGKGHAEVTKEWGPVTPSSTMLMASMIRARASTLERYCSRPRLTTTGASNRLTC